MKPPIRLSFDRQLLIAEWLRKNVEFVAQNSASKIAEVCSTFVKFEVSSATILRICRTLKLKTRTAPPRNLNDSRTVNAVLAKAIMEIANNLGYSLNESEVLSKIIARRNIGDEETSS